MRLLSVLHGHRQPLHMIVGDFLSDILASLKKGIPSLLEAKPVMIVGAIPSLIPAGIVSP